MKIGIAPATPLVCPDCNGGFDDHNAVNKISSGFIAHSRTGGACWKSAGSAFTFALLARLTKASLDEVVETDRGLAAELARVRSQRDALLAASVRVRIAEDAVAGLDDSEMSESQWEERELAWSEFRAAIAAAEKTSVDYPHRQANQRNQTP